MNRGSWTQSAGPFVECGGFDVSAADTVNIEMQFRSLNWFMAFYGDLDTRMRMRIIILFATLFC